MSESDWTDARILDALGEWGWGPPGSEVINTDEYRVVFLPEEYGHRATVPRIDSDRPGTMIIREVAQLASTRGYGEISWSIYPTTRPESLGDDLVALGGTVIDEGALMSLRVPDSGLLEVGPTPGVEVRRVREINGLTDYRRIISTVYEQPLPSAAEIVEESRGIPQDKLGCRFVAYIDGEPVGTGAIAIRADGSASLFGAATYQEFRGRGAYRAILAARTRWASEKDVPVLLVSGRLTTSAPIMKRVGFTHHGYTRNISLSTRSDLDLR